MRMHSMRLLSPPSIILAPCPLPPSNPFHCSPLSTSLSPLDFTVRFPSMTSRSVTLPLPFSLPLPLPFSLPLPLPFRFPTAPFRYRSDSHSSTRRIPKPPNGLTLQVFSGAPSDGTCTHGDLELFPASFPASLTCLERHEEDRASCTWIPGIPGGVDDHASGIWDPRRGRARGRAAQMRGMRDLKRTGSEAHGI